MRDLKYRPPSKVYHGRIEDGKRLDCPGDGYFSKFTVVYTKYGIVTVLEFDWKTNSGQIFFTEFNTIMNQMMYSAKLNEVRLSDRNIKWLSTHFIKNIIEKQFK